MTTAEEMTTALRELGIAGTVRNCGTHLEVDTATAEDARRVAVVLDLLPESRREGPVCNSSYDHPARTLTVNADVTQMQSILDRLTDERLYRGELAAVQAARLKAAAATEGYIAERKQKAKLLRHRKTRKVGKNKLGYHPAIGLVPLGGSDETPATRTHPARAPGVLDG